MIYHFSDMSGIDDFIRKKSSERKPKEISLLVSLNRDKDGNLTEDSVDSVIVKILSVSNLIDEEFHVGQANQLVFRGYLGKELLKILERNHKLSHIREMECDETSKESCIDVIRTGDFVRAVENDNGSYSLKITDMLQDDMWKTIKLEEKQNKTK